MAKIENSQHPVRYLKDDYKPRWWPAFAVAGGLLAVQTLLIVFWAN